MADTGGGQDGHRAARRGRRRSVELKMAARRSAKMADAGWVVGSKMAAAVKDTAAWIGIKMAAVGSGGIKMAAGMPRWLTLVG